MIDRVEQHRAWREFLAEARGRVLEELAKVNGTERIAADAANACIQRAAGKVEKRE